MDRDSRQPVEAGGVGGGRGYEQYRNWGDRPGRGPGEFVEREAVGGRKRRAIDSGRREVGKLDRANLAGLQMRLGMRDRFAVAGDRELQRLRRGTEIGDRQASV